jgi:hypothetical protein
MFDITNEEFSRSQFATLNKSRVKTLPIQKNPLSLHPQYKNINPLTIKKGFSYAGTIITYQF